MQINQPKGIKPPPPKKRAQIKKWCKLVRDVKEGTKQGLGVHVYL
jgi:hypothetical protein